MYPWRLHKFSLMWPQLYTTKLQDYGYYFTNNPLSCGKKIKKKKTKRFPPHKYNSTSKFCLNS